MRRTFHLTLPRIRPHRKEIEYIVPDNGCWHCVSHRGTRRGYIQIRIDGRLTYLHRLSYEQYKGPIPQGMEILHACDNPKCFNPAHLSYGTRQANLMDRELKGRTAKGEQQGKAKLKAHQIPIIRKDLRSNRLIAQDYGVCPATIRLVKLRETWKHIKEEA